MPKNYSNTYLYGKYPEYDKALFKFIMDADIIDKDAADFSGVLYEVKRRQTISALMKVLKSDVIVLMTSVKSLPRQFKVFCAKDIRNGSKKDLKVYIDCSDILTKNKEGNWVCNEIDQFISYLVSAMVNVIYYKDERLFLTNSNIAQTGSMAFSSLMTNIVDYVAKISSTPKNKAYCQYLCAKYFISNILGKDETTSGNRNICLNISGLSEREADIVDMQIEKQSFDNIKFFANTLSKILRINKLTVDLIVERWMYLYGVSSVFAMELFPAFSDMMTNCYIGAYLNNQKTIEKIAGNSMVEFTKTVLKIGSEVV